MKNIKEYGYLFILLILQTALFTRIKFFGAIPNLVLVFSVCVFSVNKMHYSAVFGAVAGLMLDWVVGSKTGLNAIILLYLGVFVSYISGKYFYKRGLYIIILTFLSSVVYNVLFLILNFYIWGVSLNFAGVIFVIYQAIIDALFAVLGYFFYVRYKNALNSELSFKKEVMF